MGVRKLRKMLVDGFPGAEVRDLGRPPEGSRIGGVLLWKRFEGLDQIDRQQAVWRLLRARLTPEEQQEIGLIMTLTPHEFEMITAP
ncbi:MAG: hypothetical protein FJ313_06770 [Gemmatimonadetes bacterium]|nr:hypothetical protein [Gemmatimonadota bacterium]